MTGEPLRFRFQISANGTILSMANESASPAQPMVPLRQFRRDSWSPKPPPIKTDDLPRRRGRPPSGNRWRTVQELVGTAEQVLDAGDAGCPADGRHDAQPCLQGLIDLMHAMPIDPVLKRCVATRFLSVYSHSIARH